MNEFYQKFPKFQVMIVWSRDAYELLKYNSNAYGYKMPRHRVVVLQEILQDIRLKGKKKIGRADGNGKNCSGKCGLSKGWISTSTGF